MKSDLFVYVLGTMLPLLLEYIFTFFRFQSCHDLTITALGALKIRAEYELLTNSIQVLTCIKRLRWSSTLFDHNKHWRESFLIWRGWLLDGYEARTPTIIIIIRHCDELGL